MAKQEIKYDGSDAEMMRLDLIDETGNVNNKRRNEFNQYMARVWQKNHPEEKSPYAEKFPANDELEKRLANHEERTKRKSIWGFLMGHRNAKEN